MTDHPISLAEIDVPGAVEQRYAQGETVLHQNTGIDGIYIIRSGFAQVQRMQMGKLAEIARLKPGDVFGEISLLDAAPASASVVAAEDSVVRFIRRSDLEAFIRQQPQLGVEIYRKIARTLAQRLRETTAALPLTLT